MITPETVRDLHLQKLVVIGREYPHQGTAHGSLAVDVPNDAPILDFGTRRQATKQEVCHKLSRQKESSENGRTDDKGKQANPNRKRSQPPVRSFLSAYLLGVSLGIQRLWRVNRDMISDYRPLTRHDDFSTGISVFKRHVFRTVSDQLRWKRETTLDDIQSITPRADQEGKPSRLVGHLGAQHAVTHGVEKSHDGQVLRQVRKRVVNNAPCPRTSPTEKLKRLQ